MLRLEFGCWYNREHRKAWEIPQLHTWSKPICLNRCDASRVFLSETRRCSRTKPNGWRKKMDFSLLRAWMVLRGTSASHFALMDSIAMINFSLLSIVAIIVMLSCLGGGLAWLDLQRQFQLFLSSCRNEKSKFIIISEAHFWWWLVNKTTLKIAGRRRSALKSLSYEWGNHTMEIFSHVKVTSFRCCCIFIAYFLFIRIVIQW